MVSNGVITTVAGNGTQGFNGDNGPANSATLNTPVGVAVDASGNLYIADTGNSRVRMVSNGVITTVAGDGTQGFSISNGPATGLPLFYPGAVAVDNSGHLYIAAGVVRMVSNGVITTVAGNGNPGFSGDNGPATKATLSPDGIAVDTSGNLYIADRGSNRVRMVWNGIITTVAGNGTPGFSGDNGPATSASLNAPSAVVVDASGNLYVGDISDNRVRMISKGVITTVAGNGAQNFGGDNGPATSAQLNSPTGAAVDASGNLYIADTSNNRVRMVSNGVITTVVGNGTSGFSGDNGPAINAQLSSPTGAAVDASGNLYIADSGNNRVRMISNGIITTVAGNGTQGFGDNGPGFDAQLRNPTGVVIDTSGNLYIVDSGNNRVRVVSHGVITTVAGNGRAGFNGDNGPATSASLNTPFGVAVDPSGNLYITDTGNNRVRMVSHGVITTVAGNGARGFRGDNGPATSASLWVPSGVAVDTLGSLYIADSANNRVRVVSKGVIRTVAGNGNQGFSGDDGPSSGAALNSPNSVALDSRFNLYVSDEGNHRVRILVPSASAQ
jgi:sugar lactone lactonase YvrE